MAVARTEARLGDVPHFDVVTVGGERIHYREIWQRRNLVLLVVSSRDREAAVRYASQLEAHREEFDEAESATVVTADAVPGLTPPRVVVADRWGEILYMWTPPANDLSQLPGVDELLSWVRFARIQCPECPP